MDSSAVLSVVLGEPDAAAIVTALANAPARRMSAANWLETCLRVDTHSDPEADKRFEALMQRFASEIVPVSVEIARVARTAGQRFGRGSGSKARLNFGDCFAYALAHVMQEPLLFKGDDFTHTDIAQAAY